MYVPVPEEFENLKGPFVQNPSLFCVSSVRFSSPGISLSGKFVEFNSGHRGQLPPFSSVQFISLSSRTLPALTCIVLADLQGLLVQSSNWFGISSVQFSSVGTSLSGKFFQFSSGHRNQMLPFSSFSSVHPVQLRTLPALVCTIKHD